MKKLIILSLSIFSIGIFAQQKTQFNGSEYLLKSVVMNEDFNFYRLIYNRDGIDYPIKTIGDDHEYNPQTSGFKLDDYDDGYYYIVLGKDGKITYVTELSDLKTFIGTIDNGEEAAIEGIINGYVIDEEFENLAANFHESGENFIVELGKVTSEVCPYQKKFYQLTVNKTTGKIIDEKEKGVYHEIYDKTCENNPHYEALNEQMDEAAAEAEKKRLENKEQVKKNKRALLRRMRRN